MLNPMHSAVYFSPALAKELAPYGIEDPSAVYFAGRAAPLGAVGAGAVTATFYNFSHSLIARFLPMLWESASPATVLAARLRAVDTMMRELLGEQALDSAGDGGSGTARATGRRGLHAPGTPAVRRQRRPARMMSAPWFRASTWMITLSALSIRSTSRNT